MSNWMIMPNGIYNSETQEMVEFKDERAFPFFATHRFGVICGQAGDSHSVALADKDSIITYNLMRNIRNIPNFAEDAFPELDFTNVTRNYEKASMCYKAMKEDIFCEGRCYNLGEEVVFMFWQSISDEEKKEIIHAVSVKNGLDESKATVAHVNKLGSSPDTIYIGYKAFNYKDSRAKTFILFKDGRVKVIPGSNHSIYFASAAFEAVREKAKKGIKTNRSKEEAALKASVDCDGRFWDLMEEPMINKIIFALWTSNISKSVKAAKDVCEEQGLNVEDAYLACGHDLIKISEYTDYVPTDADYANNPFNDSSEQDKLDALRQMHTAEQGETVEDFRKKKLDATSAFRQARDAKWDSEHMNDNGTIPTRAEWNFRTKMDEDKKKNICLNEEQVSYLKQYINKKKARN